MTKFIEKEVIIPSEDIILAGTLSIPEETPGENLPAVLILVGARAWDRDGNIRKGTQFGHYRDLAQDLAYNGYIVLRYDKRGLGNSDGTFPANDLLLAQDALAAFRWLREQPHVDRDKIIIIGHSQGTRITTLIAERLAGLAAVILLAPVVGKRAAEYYKCPVLLVGGERDNIVFQQWVANLAKDFKNSGNSNCRYIIIPGADHLFFDTSEGEPDFNGPSTTIHPMLLNKISAWLKEII